MGFSGGRGGKTSRVNAVIYAAVVNLTFGRRETVQWSEAANTLVKMALDEIMDGDLIRFVTRSRHPPYGHRSGIIQAAFALWREHRLAAPDHDELRALLDWFNDHLAKPKRFTRSRYPRAQNTAISWIRASARDLLVRLRRIVALLEHAGLVVDELRTRRPGYVVYQDDSQVVALPFADTPC